MQLSIAYLRFRELFKALLLCPVLLFPNSSHASADDWQQHEHQSQQNELRCIPALRLRCVRRGARLDLYRTVAKSLTFQARLTYQYLCRMLMSSICRQASYLRLRWRSKSPSSMEADWAAVTGVCWTLFPLLIITLPSPSLQPQHQPQ